MLSLENGNEHEQARCYSSAWYSFQTSPIVCAIIQPLNTRFGVYPYHFKSAVADALSSSHILDTSIRIALDPTSATSPSFHTILPITRLLRPSLLRRPKPLPHQPLIRTHLPVPIIPLNTSFLARHDAALALRARAAHHLRAARDARGLELRERRCERREGQAHGVRGQERGEQPAVLEGLVRALAEVLRNV